MNLRIEHDLSGLVQRLGIAPERLVRAHVDSINDVAFEARPEFQREMEERFDNVTPYLTRSVWVEKATVQNPEAKIWPRYMGGKGVDPAKILRAQVTGGPRRNKRFEVALQRAGILPAGMAAVPADGMDPAFIDAYGNVKGSFIVQLLSYLNAFSEQGYRSNMTDKRRKALAKRDKTESGFVRINGVEYFVSRGRGEFNGRQQHLAAGIWSRRGIHGSDVRPVFLWTKRMPAYQRRLSPQLVAQRVINRRFGPAFSARLARILK